MFYIADLHIHSHYSRATSKDLNLETLYQWARVKGIHVVGTGDFTHPQWFKELQEKLEPDGNGLFRLKNPPATPALPGMKVQDIDVRFCLTSEISSIYKYGDKVRKNHNLVYAPDFETVARINAKLSTIGNLASDGRPILGLPSRDLLEIVLAASDQAYLVPAHVWTPWFSTLGSRGGYDSIDECFRDLSGHIFAIETGLSSDPAMNWQWSALDRFTLISSSDAHSPQKLGREANLFNTERSYEGLFNALKTQKGFLGTYEFFPEEGKYHHDGHRKCGISWLPEESVQHNCLCPQCGEPLTIGVLHRIQKLSDRAEPKKPEGAASFDYIIPLPEILSEIKGSGPDSKAVQQLFHQTISTFGNEFNVLKEVPVEDLNKQGGPVLAEAIRRMRAQEVKPVPGYDGLYGVIKIFEEGEVKNLSGQLYLLGGQETPAVKNKKGTFAGATAAVQAFNPVVKAMNAPLQLNPAQEQVKAALTGAVLVTAGPGTGKTSTLIQWISQQITSGQAAPGQVLAITFTQKAAAEIKERLTHTLGDDVRPMRVGTFHAIAYRMLQDRSPELDTVYDEESRLSIIRFLFPELKESDSKKLCEALANLFELEDSSGFPNIHSYAERYCDYVQQQHAVDISHILTQVIDSWKKEPAWLEQYRRQVQAIAVDEFQDINTLQYTFIQLLGAGKNILAIGDPDQAIYGFRGSDVKLFFRFATEFNAQQISLTQNYRSTRTILEAAGQVIQQNTVRSGLQLEPTKHQGPRIKVYNAPDALQEAKYIIREIEKHVGGFHQLTSGVAHKGGYVFSDIAILFRTHAVGKELLSLLQQSDIPVHLSDGKALLAHAPFSVIADILRIYLHPNDMVALHGVLHYALGWEKQEIRTYLSQLHTKQQDWRIHAPTAISKKAKDNFLFWKTFYEQLPDVLLQRGAGGAVQAICRQYLPDGFLKEEQLLKKATIITLAKEAQADVHQFLEDTTLSVHTTTGQQQAYGVHLLTFHAAKGLEFPVVFIAGAEKGITPSGRQDTDMEEERRLFYVALTRAKEELHITHAATRILYGKEQQQEISPFVNDISDELREAVKAAAKKEKSKTGEDQLSLF